MRVLFLSQYSLPHFGGVEKHMHGISKILNPRGYKIKVITKKDIKCPDVKFLGLLYIWLWLLKNINLIKKSDVIHCHDVFIWYLPFRFLFPNKKIFTTFHGGQDTWPIPFKNKLQARVASWLSNGSIAIGSFIPKYYGVKPNFISYGAVSMTSSAKVFKKENLIIFLGRLEKTTGVLEFIKRIKKYKNYKTIFVGDGSSRKLCEKYGQVTGFTNPIPFLKKAKICFAGGYLAALESLIYGCKLWVGWNTPIKKDYWKLSPFLEKDSLSWAKKQTWSKMADLYINLWSK